MSPTRNGRASGKARGSKKAPATRAASKSKPKPQSKPQSKRPASKAAPAKAATKPQAKTKPRKASARVTAKKSSARRASGKSEAAAASGTPEPAEDLPAVTPADLSAFKEGKLYYRIGEVSQITGVKPYVLRYWESEFRLMAPQKSRSRQRLYRQKDIEAILHIKRLLYEERYTIAGARRRLRELGAERVRSESPLRKPAAAAGAAAGGAVPDATAELGAILSELQTIRALLSAEA